MELLDILIEIRKGEQRCTNGLHCHNCDKYQTFEGGAYEDGGAYCLEHLEYYANELKKRGVDVPPKWKSASAEPPPAGLVVLLCDIHNNLGSGYLREVDGVTIWHASLRDPIVAWRPAPAMPTLEQITGEMRKAAYEEEIRRYIH